MLPWIPLLRGPYCHGLLQKHFLLLCCRSMQTEGSSAWQSSQRRGTGDTRPCQHDHRLIFGSHVTSKRYYSPTKSFPTSGDQGSALISSEDGLRRRPPVIQLNRKEALTISFDVKLLKDGKAEIVTQDLCEQLKAQLGHLIVRDSKGELMVIDDTSYWVRKAISSSKLKLGTYVQERKAMEQEDVKTNKVGGLRGYFRKIDKTIDQNEAFDEFMLLEEDLRNLPYFVSRSATTRLPAQRSYLLEDVKFQAVKKWGSIGHLNKLRKNDKFIDVMNRKKDRDKLSSTKSSIQVKKFFSSPSTKVVLSAIAANVINTGLKSIAWWKTGSDSMFAEAVHSFVDVINQSLLLLGLLQSMREADMEHPYGYSVVKYMYSMVAGFAFFIGGGVTNVYRGVTVLWHGSDAAFSPYAVLLLGITTATEFASLYYAYVNVARQLKEKNITWQEFVTRGYDPNMSLVLLEDMAAVLGNIIAGSCLLLSHYTNWLALDAVGCVSVGFLLAGVAIVIIKSNSDIIMGQSIPMKEKEKMMNFINQQNVIKSLHDVKITSISGGEKRVKCEVAFFGSKISKEYMEKMTEEDKIAQLAIFQSAATIEDTEDIIMDIGARIVDSLGLEIDKIETVLKQQFPDVRHVDIEPL